MAMQRSASPTTEIAVRQRDAQKHMLDMVEKGLHIFNPAWQDPSNGLLGRRYSTSFKDVTFKVYGGDEELTFPVQTCTKVEDVKMALAKYLMVKPNDLSFICRKGCNFKIQRDCEEIERYVTVKGITHFTPQAFKWPHPALIIGTGYNGIKQMMRYIIDKNRDFVAFDRNSRVGGYCWITAANKTSKLQTEFGSFHVWFGPEFAEDPQQRCKGGPWNLGWEYWPKKARVLEHFQLACDDYGMTPHISFRSNCSKLNIRSDENKWINDRKRFYEVTVESLDGGKERVVECSAIYCYPGSMTKNRIVTFPGEDDQYQGTSGYGMNDDTPYDELPKSKCCIIGNGAFAVENCRTCIEGGCDKVYLLTRRKNLPSPRFPCWFVHQSAFPVPGAHVLDHFAVMHKACGWDDPWDYWSVHAFNNRTKASIIQQSRFGIGDVTYAAVAYGKLEYIEDTCKRMTAPKTLHLTSGNKLEGIDHILKATGLLGDFEVDRFHKMKAIVGHWPDGDFRRIISIDAPGLNAGNFATFSNGIGMYGNTYDFKYCIDFPDEYYRAEIEMDIRNVIPKHEAEPDVDKPAYVTDVRFETTVGMSFTTFFPKCAEHGALANTYKHQLYMKTHPFEDMLAVCTKEWDAYQKTWKEQGCTHDYIPYPYTKEIVDGWYQRFYNDVGQAMGLKPNGDDDVAAQDFGKMQMMQGKMNGEDLGFYMNRTDISSNSVMKKMVQEQMRMQREAAMMQPMEG